VFSKPPILIFLTVLMSAPVSSQDTPTLDWYEPPRALAGAKTTSPASATVVQLVSSGTVETDALTEAASAVVSIPLIGDPTVESRVEKVSVGQAEAFQTVAIYNGTVTSLTIYLDASSTSTQLFVGVYTASGRGHPESLLGQGSSTDLRAGAWNTIQVPPISVSRGHTYWFAVLGTQKGQPALRGNSHKSSCISQTSYHTNLTSLPATWTTGADRSNSCPLAAYGLGSTAGVLTANRNGVNFGHVTVGDYSALPVMLTNTGNAGLTISAAAATGHGFRISRLSLPLTLKPGNKTSFAADFAPTATGAAAGQISLTSNGSDPSVVVALWGVGVHAPRVTLSWTASTSSGVVGYNLYRGGQSGGAYTLLNTTLISGTSYQDTTVEAGQTYYYVNKAVNSHGVKSVYSNQAQVVVPSP